MITRACREGELDLRVFAERSISLSESGTGERSTKTVGCGDAGSMGIPAKNFSVVMT